MTIHPEHLQFTTPDGLVLPGLLFAPIVPTKTAVIYLHGNGSSSVFNDIDGSQAMSTALSEVGAAYFAFDNRGAGYVKRLHTCINGVTARATYGTSYELIRECIPDINGALSTLRARGYEQFFLMGASTGANKICVYDQYAQSSPFAGYILSGGGDDSGIYYQILGAEKFQELILRSKAKVAEGLGRALVPEEELGGTIMSYQSLLDTIDPDGDYNIFPFDEAFSGKPRRKSPLFKEYASLSRPSLTLYGEHDQYCSASASEAIALLEQTVAGKPGYSFELIQDTDHGFNGKERELAQAVANWLRSVKS